MAIKVQWFLLKTWIHKTGQKYRVSFKRLSNFLKQLSSVGFIKCYTNCIFTAVKWRMWDQLKIIYRLWITILTSRNYSYGVFGLSMGFAYNKKNLNIVILILINIIVPFSPLHTSHTILLLGFYFSQLNHAFCVQHTSRSLAVPTLTNWKRPLWLCSPTRTGTSASLPAWTPTKAWWTQLPWFNLSP